MDGVNNEVCKSKEYFFDFIGFISMFIPSIDTLTTDYIFLNCVSVLLRQQFY